jgi:hypothetical protein
MMKKGVESCGAQTAQAKEATSTGANVLEIPERGAQEPTRAWAEMGDADPTITFSAACKG